MLEAFQLGDRVIALSPVGKLLWEAEFPKPIDYYHEVVSREPLVVASVSSFTCRIDEATGQIIEREFYE